LKIKNINSVETFWIYLILKLGWFKKATFIECIWIILVLNQSIGWLNIPYFLWKEKTKLKQKIKVNIVKLKLFPVFKMVFFKEIKRVRLGGWLGLVRLGLVSLLEKIYFQFETFLILTTHLFNSWFVIWEPHVLKSRFLFNIIKDTQPEIFFGGGEDVVEGCLGGLLFFS